MKKAGYYLGIDLGSVSTNLVVIDEDENIMKKVYIRSGGQPINSLRKGIEMLVKNLPENISISGAGTTGSGRMLAGVITGADVVKNEITSHAVAAQKMVPGVRTVLEIGGQDSKIIILRDGVVSDFAMNTVCAAGTGSFLDRQAARLEIPIEEFGKYALKSKSPVRIAGRCAVFAESDMIHKQQTGHCIEDITSGLCEALVRNYMNNLAKGKDLKEPIVFQGGVAANVGIVAAFEKELGMHIIIPEYYDVMGALGAAMIAKESVSSSNAETKFYGFKLVENDYKALSIDCSDCPNSCEVIEIVSNGAMLARWGDRCGKWTSQASVERQGVPVSV